ncbi:MAG: hypothetical protein ACOCWA_10090 [Bacteroidota bacterium]
MGFKNTIEIITKDIQELEKIVRNFENYSRIPGIEMDLALDKTRNLYELLLMIKDYNIENPAPAGNQQKETSVTEYIKENEGPDKHNFKDETSKPREDLDFIEKDNKKEKKEAIPEDQIYPGEETSVQKKNNPHEEPSLKEKILAEKFQKPGDFLNEKIGGNNTKKDLSAKIQSTPIKSISGSMGINDKFLFIRELFHGNADHFKIAMKTLDDASNFNEAYNYIINTFEWDMDSEEVQQLLNLIRRKFISSGND